MASNNNCAHRATPPRYDNIDSIDWTASSSNLVWLSDDRNAFVAASIVEQKKDSKEVLVKILESDTTLVVSTDEVQKMNPPKCDKVEDMAELLCLNEASVLHNLHQRYCVDLIYTYSSLFCIVVNPYKSLQMYTDEIVAAYCSKKRRHELPPHIYAVANAAYSNMLTEHENQSILCTGESGAGKTENTKKVIQYLTYAASTSKRRHSSVDAAGLSTCQGHLERQLLQTNIILESFGNAKTAKNDNSSRFEKFIRISFDTSGIITGASIETYLLEKSRVVRHAPSERTFHVFYDILCDAPQQMKDDCYLDDNVTSCTYLSPGDVCVLDREGELRGYCQLMCAMDVLGFTPTDLANIQKILSAILHLGNVRFLHDLHSDQVTLAADKSLQKVSELIGVAAAELTTAFLQPRIRFGREFVARMQTREQVEFSVDAISKSMFERVFKFVVRRINQCLDVGKRDTCTSFIGILDIAGFEVFEVNSFEQLCINYTNEKLQQLFNDRMFVLEQQEYERENIDWTYIDFGLDLRSTIDLIEQPFGGILSLIDDECFFPKSTDKILTEKLIAAHSSHPKFGRPGSQDRHSGADFSVKHYAGRVDYCCSQWLVKNADPLNRNVVALLLKSSVSFVQSLWTDEEAVGDCFDTSTAGGDAGASVPTRTRDGMLRTVSQTYKDQLAELMATLNATTPNFVRCILPNREKVPGKMDLSLVLDQLRCNGVVEGLRICRQGFPNRITFRDFCQRYGILARRHAPGRIVNDKETCIKMINAFEIDDRLYRIGRTKLFFRAGIVAHLEEDRDRELARILTQFQAHVRGYLTRRKLRYQCQQRDAVRVVQRSCSAFRKLSRWPWWQLFTQRPTSAVSCVKLPAASAREEQRRDYVQELDRLRTDYDALLTNYRVLEAKCEKNVELFNHINRLYTDVEEECTQLNARNGELEGLLDDCTETLVEARGQVLTFAEESEKFQTATRDLEERLEHEARARQTLQLEKTAVESRLKSVEHQQVMLSTEKHDLELKIADLVGDQHEQVEVTSSTEQKMMSSVEHDGETQSKATQVELVDIAELLAILDQQMARCAVLERKQMSTEEEVAKERAAKECLLAELEAAERTKKVSETRQLELEQEAVELREELEEADATCRDQQLQLNNLLSSVGDLVNQKLLSRVEELERNGQRTCSELEQTKETKLGLEVNIDTLQRESKQRQKDFEEKIAHLQNQVNELKLRVEADRRHRLETLSRCRQLKVDYHAVRWQFRTLSQNHDEETRRWKQFLQEKVLEIQDLKSKLLLSDKVTTKWQRAFGWQESEKADLVCHVGNLERLLKSREQELCQVSKILSNVHGKPPKNGSARITHSSRQCASANDIDSNGEGDRRLHCYHHLPSNTRRVRRGAARCE